MLLALIAGLAVAAGAIYALSRDLPSLDELRRHTNAVNTVLYDRTGKNVIAELHGAENRVLVPSEKIPDVMKEATVAVEDERFYEHHGVDYQGVARAMILNLRAGTIVQGGSTITEQFVKNAYVGDERTYTRKLREAVLAWQLEDRWSKDQILTEYLNTVYYGAGAYGVEAAARTYFHKHASELNVKEAALLAALPKFPSAYSPTTDKKMATEQRNKVLQLMADQGYITQQRADKLMPSKLHVFRYPPNPNKSLADYFVDYVTRQLTKRYGSAMVFEGGLKVVTSIDLEWQQEAIEIVKSTTGPLDFGFKPSAALVAIDPATGYIRTMVGGLDYKKQKFNLAWQAKRQPGSSMKPFVLAAAVEKGMNPDSTYYSSKSPIIIPMGAYAEPWLVNGDGPGGPESVSAATTISDNVVFAQLSVDVGPESTVDIAHRMGITSPLDAVPSITLGTSGVTPLEMADAYATLAANGVHHRPQAIVKVVPRRRHGRLEAEDDRQARHPRRRRQRGHAVPRARRVGRHRLGDRVVLPLPARRQDRHHGERLGRLVRGLHAQARGRRLDGRRREELAHGRRLRRHLLRADVGQVLRRGAQGPGAPELQGLPVDVQPVGGQDADHVAVGVAVGERQRDAEPRPDQDHHAEADADQDRDADAAADADQDAQADADRVGQPSGRRRWSRRRAPAAAGPAWPATSSTGSPACSRTLTARGRAARSESLRSPQPPAYQVSYRSDPLRYSLTCSPSPSAMVMMRHDISSTLVSW